MELDHGAATKTTMWALRMVRPESDPELAEVSVPAPGAGEARVRVGGAGVCHSDIHLLYQPHSIQLPLPFTLGHETAGWVDTLGPGVTGPDVGTPVVVYGCWGCGFCQHCAAGAENYCSHGGIGTATAGVGRDGGIAEYVVVPARALVPLPDGLDPVRAAPLADAALTPFHAIRRAERTIRPGSTVAVIGVGGLGHLAVQILKRTTGATVVAVDRRADALALALRCGADDVVEVGETGGLGPLGAADGGRVDTVLDFVASEASVRVAAGMVGANGHIGLVGAGDGVLPVSGRHLPPGVTTVFTYWGTRPDLIEVLRLAARGALEPVIDQVPLSRAPDAVAAVRAGKVSGRAVIVPD